MAYQTKGQSPIFAPLKFSRILAKALSEYGISFTGLSVGNHIFQYVLEDAFMENFPEQEFCKLRVEAAVKLEKKVNLSMELDIQLSGFVEVRCDRSDRPFDLSVEANRLVVVHFGDAFNNDDDELLIIPHGEHELNVAQLLYESLVQSIPLKKLYPGTEEEEPEYYSSSSEEDETPDPRWAGLNALKQSQAE